MQVQAEINLKYSYISMSGSGLGFRLHFTMAKITMATTITAIKAPAPDPMYITKSLTGRSSTEKYHQNHYLLSWPCNLYSLQILFSYFFTPV
jgi:hypothetical protein